MLLKDYINEDLIFANLKPDDKLSLLKMLVEKTVARIPVIDDVELLRKLTEREEEVSTGIGHGVAVPHTTIDGLDKAICLIAQIPEGVEFASIDGTSVHCVFLLLSPPGKIGTHIKLLARIARLVRNKEFIRDISLAESSKKIFELVVLKDDSHVY